MLTLEPQGYGAPIGKHITVPSALTGLPLVYFVPDSVVELAARLKQVERPHVGPYEAVAEPAWLLISHLTSDEKRVIPRNSQSLAKLYGQILLGERTIQTTNSLILLANEITSKAKLRKQMAFSGGPTPSTAKIIYPPHSAASTLLDSLSEFLAGDLSRYDPLEVAALVSYSAVNAHPFDDANGRWSRLLSAYAGMRAGSVWSGLTASLFQKACLPQVVRLWELARTSDLMAYFEAAKNFSEQVLNACIEAGIMRYATKIGIALLDKIQNRKKARQIAFELLSTGQLTEAGLRQHLCCSQRKASGILDTLIDGSNSGVLPTSTGVTTSALTTQITEIVEKSKIILFSGEKP